MPFTELSISPPSQEELRKWRDYWASLPRRPWAYDAQPGGYALIRDSEGGLVMESAPQRRWACAIIGLANLIDAHEATAPTGMDQPVRDTAIYQLLVAMGILP